MTYIEKGGIEVVFRTVLSHRGQLADCRNLSIVAEFYDFSYQQVKNLIGDISDSVNSLQNGLFVTSWTVMEEKNQNIAVIT